MTGMGRGFFRTIRVCRMTLKSVTGRDAVRGTTSRLGVYPAQCRRKRGQMPTSAGGNDKDVEEAVVKAFGDLRCDACGVTHVRLYRIRRVFEDSPCRKTLCQKCWCCEGGPYNAVSKWSRRKRESTWDSRPSLPGDRWSHGD